jgi:hypothetical protein
VDEAVSVEARPGTDFAVKWFGGYATQREVDRRKTELRELVERSPKWSVAAEPSLLQYNDPFTPPWKRRNEVIIPVTSLK